MTAVWYVGPALERTITTAQWNAAGINGAAAVTWSGAEGGNGWSVDSSQFTGAQLTFLATQDGFLIGMPDGPRQMGWVNPGPADPAIQRFWTSEFDAAGETLPINVEKWANLTLHVKGGAGGSTSVASIFEASLDSTDGTDGTWFTVTASTTGTNVAAASTGNLTLAANAANVNAFKVNVSSFIWFRVRCTARTSGSVIWMISPSTHAVEPMPTVASHSVLLTPSTTALTAVSAASTNLTAWRTSSCYLQELAISNPTSTPAYVKLYNKTSAPVVASDVPLMIIPAPASSFQVFDFGSSGKRFTSGIGLAITGGIAATDATNAPVGVLVNGAYA